MTENLRVIAEMANMNTTSRKQSEQAAAKKAPRAADMEPAEARRLLRRCDKADEAIRDVGTAVMTGEIYAAATATRYPRTDGREDDRGSNAAFKASHWERILADRQEDGFWAAGEVKLTARPDHREVKMTGIRLNRADVISFATKHNVVSVSATPVRRRPPGPEPKYADWDDFWIEVVTLAQQGKLNQSEFRSQARLIDTLLDKIGPDTLSLNSIEPRVREIYTIFVEGKSQKKQNIPETMG